MPRLPDRLRPPDPGVARKVADFIASKGVPPEAMQAYLAEVWGVERFADLTRSHADSIWRGLSKGILLDDLRARM